MFRCNKEDLDTRMAAIDIFDKLGYNIKCAENRIVYHKRGIPSMFVIFKLEVHEVMVCYAGASNTAYNVDMELLKAINEQCRELGWK